MSNVNGTEPAHPTDREQTTWGLTGLTKREWFAGMAMQGILANSALVGWDSEMFAKDALEHADALLAALEAIK